MHDEIVLLIGIGVIALLICITVLLYPFAEAYASRLNDECIEGRRK